MKVFILAVLSVVGVASEIFLFDRECPKHLDVKTNFDVKAYLGLWYEIERYDQPFQTNADCVTAMYGERDANSITVVNKARFLANGTGTIATGVGALAYPELDPIPARLNVSFFGPTLENNYQIIDTDYEQFSFVYNCVNKPDGKSYQAYWLLSRTPVFTVDPIVVSEIQKLKTEYLDENQIRKADQSEASCSSEVEYVDLSLMFRKPPMISPKPKSEAASDVDVAIVNYN